MRGRFSSLIVNEEVELCTELSKAIGKYNFQNMARKQSGGEILKIEKDKKRNKTIHF